MFKPSGTARTTSTALDTDSLELDTKENVYVREVASHELGELMKLSEEQVNDEFFEQKLYAVYDEQGQRLAVTNDRSSAFSFAKLNNLVPASVH